MKTAIINIYTSTFYIIIYNLYIKTVIIILNKLLNLYKKKIINKKNNNISLKKELKFRRNTYKNENSSYLFFISLGSLYQWRLCLYVVKPNQLFKISKFSLLFSNFVIYLITTFILFSSQ